MSVIDIEVAMQYLRVDDDDRATLQLLLDSAEDSASQFLNRRFFVDQKTLELALADGSAGENPMVITPSIRAACLLIAGSLFGNREDVVVGTISSALPMGSRTLLMPFRIGMGV